MVIIVQFQANSAVHQFSGSCQVPKATVYPTNATRPAYESIAFTQKHTNSAFCSTNACLKCYCYRKKGTIKARVQCCFSAFVVLQYSWLGRADCAQRRRSAHPGHDQTASKSGQHCAIITVECIIQKSVARHFTFPLGG